MNNFYPQFYSGLSGLQLPYSKSFYPAPYENAGRLEYYASLFNSIEFNSSFYKLPMRSTVKKWAASVNKNFQFTFKFWNQVTHVKELAFKEPDVLEFLEVVDGVDEKKGCLLLQFPPGLNSSHAGQLENLLKCIRNSRLSGWNLTTEFRNRYWYREEIYSLLESYSTSIVRHDIPASATPMINSELNFVYVRFHGPTGNYRESYSESFLMEYSTYIREWIDEGKSVYVYFNNTMGDAFNNLSKLNSYLLSGSNV